MGNKHATSNPNPNPNTNAETTPPPTQEEQPSRGPIMLTEAVIGVSKAKKKFLGLKKSKSANAEEEKQPTVDRAPSEPIVLTEAIMWPDLRTPPAPPILSFAVHFRHNGTQHTLYIPMTIPINLAFLSHLHQQLCEMCELKEGETICAFYVDETGPAWPFFLLYRIPEFVNAMSAMEKIVNANPGMDRAKSMKKPGLEKQTSIEKKEGTVDPSKFIRPSSRIYPLITCPVNAAHMDQPPRIPPASVSMEDVIRNMTSPSLRTLSATTQPICYDLHWSDLISFSTLNHNADATLHQQQVATVLCHALKYHGYVRLRVEDPEILRIIHMCKYIAYTLFPKINIFNARERLTHQPSKPPIDRQQSTPQQQTTQPIVQRSTTMAPSTQHTQQTKDQQKPSEIKHQDEKLPRLTPYSHKLENEKLIGFATQKSRSFYQVRRYTHQLPFVEKDSDREMKDGLCHMHQQRLKWAETPDKGASPNTATGIGAVVATGTTTTDTTPGTTAGTTTGTTAGTSGTTTPSPATTKPSKVAILFDPSSYPRHLYTSTDFTLILTASFELLKWMSTVTCRAICLGMGIDISYVMSMLDDIQQQQTKGMIPWKIPAQATDEPICRECEKEKHAATTTATSTSTTTTEDKPIATFVKDDNDESGPRFHFNDEDGKENTPRAVTSTSTPEYILASQQMHELRNTITSQVTRIIGQDVYSSASTSTSTSNERQVGSDVFRLYAYYRDARDGQTALPGLRDAATGLHADMGLVTISPSSSLPGLTAFHPSATHFISCESDLPHYHIYHRDNEALTLPPVTNDTAPLSFRPLPVRPPTYDLFYVFIGETMARLCRGELRPVLHWVDERILGIPRISMPFFLRTRGDAIIRDARIPSSTPSADTTSTSTSSPSLPDVDTRTFMEKTVLTARPWNSGLKSYSDY